MHNKKIPAMKTLICGALLLLMTLGLSAQKSPVDRVFDKYSGKEGFTTVYISSFMFNLMSSIDSDDPEYDEFKKATKGITSLRILTDDGANTNFAAELIEMLPRKEYQEIMVVKDDSEEVLFLAREEGGIITEFLLIVSSDDGDDALIAFTGEIDLASISSIAQGMDMPGLENLEEMDENKLP